MSDRTFFIAAALLAAGMVVLALAPGFNQLPSGPVSGGGTDYQRIEVSGDELNRMVAGGESGIRLVQADGQTVLRVELNVEDVSNEPLRGPHFVLAQDLEVAFADRPVRVTVRARAADQRGAEAMLVNYALGQGIGSGWEEFQLTREFRDYSFVYDVPPRDEGTDAGYDYIAIRPVVPDKQRALFIASLVLEPVGPAGAEASE